MALLSVPEFWVFFILWGWRCSTSRFRQEKKQWFWSSEEIWNCSSPFQPAADLVVSGFLHLFLVFERLALGAWWRGVAAGSADADKRQRTRLADVHFHGMLWFSWLRDHRKDLWAHVEGAGGEVLWRAFTHGCLLETYTSPVWGCSLSWQRAWFRAAPAHVTSHFDLNSKQTCDWTHNHQ